MSGPAVSGAASPAAQRNSANMPGQHCSIRSNSKRPVGPRNEQLRARTRATRALLALRDSVGQPFQTTPARTQNGAART
eukprot:7902959-Alexandrium_andersonii.AAC.1